MTRKQFANIFFFRGIMITKHVRWTDRHRTVHRGFFSTPPPTPNSVVEKSMDGQFKKLKFHVEKSGFYIKNLFSLNIELALFQQFAQKPE